MENHTKRMRKARRQGLASKKPSDIGTPTRRMPLRGRGMELRELPGEKRATGRRDTAVTKRKAKRKSRGTARKVMTRKKG
jgi:hypothetical protein